MSSPVSLDKCFLIMDGKIHEETASEEDIMLYFYPNEWPLRTKIHVVTLCTAMANFSTNFTSSPLDIIELTRAKLALHKCKEFVVLLFGDITCSNQGLKSMLMLVFKCFNFYSGGFSKLVERSNGDRTKLQRLIQETGNIVLPLIQQFHTSPYLFSPMPSSNLNYFPEGTSRRYLVCWRIAEKISEVKEEIAGNLNEEGRTLTPNSKFPVVESFYPVWVPENSDGTLSSSPLDDTMSSSPLDDTMSSSPIGDHQSSSDFIDDANVIPEGLHVVSIGDFHIATLLRTSCTEESQYCCQSMCIKIQQSEDLIEEMFQVFERINRDIEHQEEDCSELLNGDEMSTSELKCPRCHQVDYNERNSSTKNDDQDVLSANSETSDTPTSGSSIFNFSSFFNSKSSSEASRNRNSSKKVIDTIHRAMKQHYKDATKNDNEDITNEDSAHEGVGRCLPDYSFFYIDDNTHLQKEFLVRNNKRMTFLDGREKKYNGENADIFSKNDNDLKNDEKEGSEYQIDLNSFHRSVNYAHDYFSQRPGVTKLVLRSSSGAIICRHHLGRELYFQSKNIDDFENFELHARETISKNHSMEFL